MNAALYEADDLMLTTTTTIIRLLLLPTGLHVRLQSGMNAVAGPVYSQPLARTLNRPDLPARVSVAITKGERMKDSDCSDTRLRRRRRSPHTPCVRDGTLRHVVYLTTRECLTGSS
jgi:hypothetical protein